MVTCLLNILDWRLECVEPCDTVLVGPIQTFQNNMLCPYPTFDINVTFLECWPSHCMCCMQANTHSSDVQLCKRIPRTYFVDDYAIMLRADRMTKTFLSAVLAKISILLESSRFITWGTINQSTRSYDAFHWLGSARYSCSSGYKRRLGISLIHLMYAHSPYPSSPYSYSSIVFHFTYKCYNYFSFSPAILCMHIIS